MKRFFNSLLALTALLTTGSMATANEYTRIVNEAIVIQEKTDMLMDETEHYHRTPGFTSLLRCVLQQNRLASRVQNLAVREANIYLLDRELDRLDAMFHKVEYLFDTIEIEASRGCGQVVGNTRHVKKLLNHVERCIRKMQRDVKRIRDRNTCIHANQGPVYPRNAPVYTAPSRPRYDFAPAYNYRPYGGGVTFGNDRISFSIGF